MLRQIQPEIKTAIHYNRSARAWQATNVQSFGSGKDGKRAARLVALAQDNHHLFQSLCTIAGQHEGNELLIERLLDACELVVTGKVYADGTVGSQYHHQVIYTTSYEWKMWRCTCDAYHYKPIPSNYGHICKHILARIIAELETLESPVQG